MPSVFSSKSDNTCAIFRNTKGDFFLELLGSGRKSPLEMKHGICIRVVLRVVLGWNIHPEFP